MPGLDVDLWLFLFAAFSGLKSLELKRGIHSRVEFTGEKLDLVEVEWVKINESRCLCLMLKNNNVSSYRQCCGEAHFYLENNTLILENVTARDGGLFKETIVVKNGTLIVKNFNLTIGYPPNVTGILASSSNTSISLRCEVSDSFQALIWKKGGECIEETNQTLHIDLSSDNCNLYSCTVSNEFGSSERQININESLCLNWYDDASSISLSVLLVLTSIFPLLAVLGLSLAFYCFCKHHKVQGNPEDDLRVYEEVQVAEAEEAVPLPYVYTDFIKPREGAVVHKKDCCRNRD